MATSGSACPTGLRTTRAATNAAAPPPAPTFVTSVQDGAGAPCRRRATCVGRIARSRSGSPRWDSWIRATSIAQVRLLGFEDAWRDDLVGEARYTGLLPGRYVFQVRSRYGTGAFGPVASRAVVVRPPWWLTWWFIALALASLALLLRAALRWRLARLHRRNVELEAIVGARTRDLQAAYVALEEASMVDPLTGLKNRRYLSAFMPEELARCLRQQQDAAPAATSTCA